MDAGIEIRRLGPGDAAPLDRVACGVSDGSVRPDRAADLACGPHRMVVALILALSVGMGSAVFRLHPGKDPRMWIGDIGTAGAWRRRGIALRVPRARLTEAEARACAGVRLGAEEGAAAGALHRRAGGREAPGPVVHEREGS